LAPHCFQTMEQCQLTIPGRPLIPRRRHLAPITRLLPLGGATIAMLFPGRHMVLAVRSFLVLEARLVVVAVSGMSHLTIMGFLEHGPVGFVQHFIQTVLFPGIQSAVRPHLGFGDLDALLLRLQSPGFLGGKGPGPAPLLDPLRLDCLPLINVRAPILGPSRPAPDGYTGED
jgi:hypothetical protein